MKLDYRNRVLKHLHTPSWLERCSTNQLIEGCHSPDRFAIKISHFKVNALVYSIVGAEVASIFCHTAIRLPFLDRCKALLALDLNRNLRLDICMHEKKRPSVIGIDHERHHNDAIFEKNTIHSNEPPPGLP